MNSPNYDCADVRQNLYLFLGGELDSTEQMAETEKHLGQCPECREELTVAKRSRELYLAAAVDTDSEELDLWPGIRSRLYSEQILEPRQASNAPGPSLAVGRSTLRRLAPWTMAAAAAAAFLLALPFLREQFASPTSIDSGPGTPPMVADPIEHDAPKADLVAGKESRLRPVLIGDESLIEREQRLLEEQRRDPASGANVLDTHPFDSSMYDVVNQRRLR